MIANPPADSKNTMVGSWLAWQHNGMIQRMWAEEGKDCPFALIFGAQPAVNMNMGTRQDDWVNEYDASSKLLDAPIEMVKCETSDIMVPADAEMVIEGTVSATDSASPRAPSVSIPAICSRNTSTPLACRGWTSSA